MKERDQLSEASDLALLLDECDISILREFESNILGAARFAEEYCSNQSPNVVLCGINPGRLGAGKTGVPFLDFSSLSKLFEDVYRHDEERSAQFFFEVIEYFGAKSFYSTFHVTNISSVGFERAGANVNYYDLPEKALRYIYSRFSGEIKAVQPTAIISLSGAVHSTVKHLFSGSSIDISVCLPHPNYCAFPKQRDRCKALYVEVLSQYCKA
jgi:hypothetical protein